MLGTEEVIACEGGNISEYDPRKYYSQEQIDAYLHDIVDGRRKFTEEIASEGLNPDINKYAEKSFEIDKTQKKKSVFIPDQDDKSENPAAPINPGSYVTKSRPPRPVGYR